MIQLISIRIFTILISLFVCGFIASAQPITMERKGAPFGGLMKEIELHPSGTLYTIVDKGISPVIQELYRSVNKGTSWSKVNFFSSAANLELDIDAAGNIWVAYASAFSSSSYTSSVFKSSDDGVTWVRVNTATNPFLNNTTWLASLIKSSGSQGNSPLYVCTSFSPSLRKSSLFRSDNGGATWQEVYASASGSVSTISTHPNGTVLLLDQTLGVLRSASGLAGTFSQVTSGLPSINLYSEFKQRHIAWVGNDVYLVWSGVGLYRSTDFGVTWVAEGQFNSMIGWQRLNYTAISATSANLYAVVGSEGTIYFRSTDGSWSLRNSYNTFAVDRPTSMVVVNFSEFYGINNNGVVSSKGNEWTSSSSGIELFGFRNWNGTNPAAQPLVFTSTGLLSTAVPFFAIDQSTGVWTRVSATGLIEQGFGYYVKRFSSGRLFFVGNASTSTGSEAETYLYTSTDDGKTWTPVPSFSPPGGMVSYNSNIYFSGANNWIFSAPESTPGSQTQITIAGLPTSFRFWGQSSFFMLGKTLFVGGRENDSPSFYKISITEANPTATKITGYSAGSTLTESGLAGFGNSLIIYSRNASQSILSVSRDLGVTWNNYNIPNTVLNYFFTSSGYPAYSTSAGQVFISPDQGESWKEVQLGLTSTDGAVRVVETGPDGYLNVVVDQKGLFRSVQPMVTPIAPSNLTAQAILPLTVRLAWNDNSDNESYFRIERSEGNNLQYDSINWATANSFSKIVQTFNVESGKNYYFRVVAVNKAGRSKYSNELQVTTPEYCASTIPSNRSWTLTTLNESGLGTRTQTNVSIIKTASASYTITSLAGNSPSWSGVNQTLNSLSATFTENCGTISLSQPNTDYIGEEMGTWDPVAQKITLKWGVNLAFSNLSEYFKETTELTLNSSDPAPTTGPIMRLAVFDDNGVYIHFATSGIAYAQQYVIYRATSSTGPWTTEIGRVNSNQPYFIDRTTLQKGTTYYYKAKSINNSGESPLTTLNATILFDKAYFFGRDVTPPDGNIDLTRSHPSFVDINNDGRDELFQTITNISQAKSGFTYFNADNTFTFKDFGNPNISNYRAKFADMNNDGNIDMISRTIDISKSKAYLEVYHGDGAGNFSNVFSKQFPTLAQQVGLIDFNLDGYLDFLAYVGIADPYSSQTSYRLTVFINNKAGSFSELYPFAVEQGAIPNDLDFGDYDLDGDMDVLLGGSFENAAVAYRLYQNNGDGTYTKKQVPLIDQYVSNFAYACQWLDLNSDGYLDIVMLFGSSGTASRGVFINNGNGTFSAGPTLALTSGGFNSIGLLSLDIENDGDLDLIINSSISNSTTQYYFNEAGGMILINGETLGASINTKSATVASDINADGYLDLFAASADRFFQFYTNAKFSSGNWLKIKLHGVKSNRSAIGARVQVIAGTKTLQRQVTVSGNGYLTGQNSLVQHVGLGTATSVTVRVIWPNGRPQVIRNVSLNKTLDVVEETDPPVVLQFFPDKSSTNVFSATKLKLTLDGTQSVVATKKITLFEGSSSTPLATLNAGDAVVSANVYTYDLPVSLPQGKLIRVEMEEGAFIDSFENPTPAISGNAWTFTVGTGPLLNARLPANNAVDVPINTNVELTFDRNITAVPGKKISIIDGTNTLVEADVASITIAQNKLVFNPANDFPYLKSLQVILEDGAIADDQGNTFQGFAAGQFVFATVIEPDAIKPVISFQTSKLSLLSKGFATVAIEVTATDNRAVDKVYFNYRKSSSKDFNSLELTASALQPNTWTGLVLNSYSDDMGFEYFLSATDLSGNLGRLPIAANENYLARITLSGADQPIVQVVGGGTAETWRIISIPYETSTSQISEIFSSLGAASLTTWRMLQYSANTNVSPVQESWLEYPKSFQTMERGQGYLINSIEAKDVNLGNPISPANSRSNLFARNLVKGWNLIGNPYSTVVLWDDIRAFNNLNDKVSAIKILTNGTYSNGNEILPLRGGFVFANEPIDNVKISFPNQTASGGRLQEKVWAGGEWMMPITLRQGNRENNIGGVGMHRQSKFTYDPMDDLNPPSLGDGLRLSFDHPEYFIKAFARDVVPLQEEFQWDFKVEVPASSVTEMVWNPSLFNVEGKQLFLMDMEQQIVVDMQQENSYQFYSINQNRFRIYFGSNLQKTVMPERLLLAAPMPNPTNDRTQINFTLPENTGLLEVKLEVMDLMGRTLSVLEDASLPTGFYSKVWDNSAFPSGMYLVRLRVIRAGKAVVNSRLLVKN